VNITEASAVVTVLWALTGQPVDMGRMNSAMVTLNNRAGKALQLEHPVDPVLVEGAHVIQEWAVMRHDPVLGDYIPKARLWTPKQARDLAESRSKDGRVQHTAVRRNTTNWAKPGRGEQS
jgi:hypothetical protein